MLKYFEVLLNAKATQEFTTGIVSIISIAFTALFTTWLKNRQAKKEAVKRTDQNIKSEQERIIQEKEAQALNFNFIRRRIIEIDRILFELRNKLGAYRVVLIQFHNGGNWFAGDSILRLTITNEAADDTAERIQKHFQNLIIPGFWIDYIEQLYIKGNLHIPDCSMMRNQEMRDLVTFYGSKELFDVVIADEYGLPVGYISVRFKTPNALNLNSIEGIKIEVARIKNILLMSREKIAVTKVLTKEHNEVK